jgi:hypothetical protein
MSRRVRSRNLYESALNGAITSGAASITVSSVAGLGEPGRLVIDPDVPAKTEFIRYETIVGSVLTTVTRNLDGGVPSAHDDGAIIRSVPMHQDLDDIFSDIEDTESDVSTHTGAANPHSNSAAADDLVATDAQVATNTAGIAANVTNLTTHEADAENHSIKRVVTGADYAIGSFNVWLGVLECTFVVPTSWVTYDLIITAGGNISKCNNTDKVRVHAAAPGYAALLTDGISFMSNGEMDIQGGGSNDIPFAIKGYNHLGVITRTAYPTVSAWLELEQDVGPLDDSVIKPWIEVEARRRS